MTRYRLTEPYADKLRVYQPGEEIEHEGPPARFMVPVNPDLGSIPQMREELAAVRQQRHQVAGEQRVAKLRAQRGDRAAAEEVAVLDKKLHELGELAREIQDAISHAEHELQAQTEQRRLDVEDRIFGALDVGAVEVAKLCERIDKSIGVLARELARLQKATLDAHALLGPVTPIGSMLDTSLDPFLISRTAIGRLFRLAGLPTAALSTLTPAGIDSLATYGTVEEVVTQYFAMLQSRRPPRDVEPLGDITEETANGEASP